MVLSMLAALAWAPVALSAPATKNVLFIMVDDLRPNIGAYGHSFMSTPNIDKLAQSGTLFQRAYVQYSFCAPSRNSFMTGRRPDATKVFSFTRHFRMPGVGDQWVTMPQWFKRQGYNVYGSGKMFHKGLPPNFDAPYSWDEFVYPGGCEGDTNGWPVLEPNITGVTCPKVFNGCDNRTGAIVAKDETGDRWCAIDTNKLNESVPIEDTSVLTNAISFLQRAAKSYNEEEKPFFIGAGFHKPHLPFWFPKEFLDLYPEDVAPPKHPLPPKGMPLCAWHEGNFDNKWDQPCDHTAEFRRAYYAATSFTDSNIGKLLDELDSLGLTDSTLVAMMGDHGWQLGELNEWRKMTNFELGVRVPLIIRAPWKNASIGVKSPAIVEAVDLFQTFVGLTGVAKVPDDQKLQGEDLTPLFDTPLGYIEGQTRYAFSQFAKGLTHSSELKEKVDWDTCNKCQLNTIDVQGYSVRGADWRYTEWLRWNQTSKEPIWGQVVGRELYNHTGDDGSDFDRTSDIENVWNASKANKQISEQLSEVLKQHFKNDHLPPQ